MKRNLKQIVVFSGIAGMAFCFGSIPASAEEITNGIVINEENFPDESFRGMLKENFDQDDNGIFDEEEIESASWIDCENRGIQSLAGIEYFTEVENLYCNNNQLTSLDISANTKLAFFDCGNNQLTELNTSENSALIELNCSDNQLTELDVSANTELQKLFCESNQLTELDVSANTELQRLDCDDNQLTELDMSSNQALEELGCSENALTVLTLGTKPVLKTVYCDSNQLTSLDASGAPSLAGFDGGVQNYQISVGEDLVYDLTELPGQFDVSKARDWFGGKVDGNILTVEKGANAVAYTYDVGSNENSFECTLEVEAPEVDDPVEEDKIIANVTLPKQKYTYTGKAITPKVKAFDEDENVLVEGVDYTVEYEDNVEMGFASVYVTGIGNFSGTYTATFIINPATTDVKSLSNTAKGIKVTWNANRNCDKYEIYRKKNGGEPEFVTSIGSSATLSYTDIYAKTNGAKYQYLVMCYKKVGVTEVYSTFGKGPTIYYLTRPAISSFSSTAKKTATAKWNKNSKATGYKIEYATNSKFTSKKTVTVKGASTVTKKLTGLSSKKTYYVRIRSYKTVSGKTYYSDYSAVKKVKVK